MKNLIGRKILLFYPKYFGYETKMIEQIEMLGGKVDYFDPRCFSKAFGRSLIKVAPNYIKIFSIKYHKNIINKIGANDYDTIIVHDRIPKEAIIEYKKTFPKAKMILSFFDSIINLKGYEEIFSYFDEIYTFDKEDSIKYGFKYHPLFYTDDYSYSEVNHKYKYDLCFIGTYRIGRYKVIKAMKEYSKKSKKTFYCYCYLQSWFMFLYYKLLEKEFKEAKIKEFTTKKLEARKVSEIIKKSKVVLDIESKNQNGLTIRTIEMLGLRKKIITTNKNIKDYNFYNSSNIMVIDRDSPRVNEDFFNKEYIKLSNLIYKEYMLESWIIDILGEVKNEIFSK